MNAKTQNCSTVVQSHFTRSNRNNTQRRACNQTAPILQVTSQDENFFMSKSNKLEGDLNFIAWKVRIKFAFMRESVWYTDNRTSSTSTIEQDGAEVINTNSLLTSSNSRQQVRYSLPTASCTPRYQSHMNHSFKGSWAKTIFHPSKSSPVGS